MKKTLLALAVLSAFAGAASAQSSVTLSGRVDAGVIRSGGAWTMGGSSTSYNALTFSGTEDLGGGLRAFFALNHRFNLNTGTTNPGGNAAVIDQFYRNSWVGLGGGFGDIRLGRILMPLQDMNGGFDAFDAASVGSTHAGGINATVRANNAIYYRSPSLGGLTFQAAIAAGDQQIASVPTGSPAGTRPTVLGNGTERPTGFNIGYAAGPLRLGVAWDQNTLDRNTVGVYGGFNAGFANFMFQYEKGDLTAATEVDRWSVSAKVPMGALTFKIGYLNQSDENTKKVGAGLQYDLSKRTFLYSNVGKLSGSAPSSTAKKAMFDVGVNHAF
jgi:predicted porin